MKFTPMVAAATAAVIACLMVPTVTNSQDLVVLRVGRPEAISLTSLPVIVGESTGIWKSVGLTIQASSLRGDAQVQQALAADSVDTAMGSGPGIAFLTKGVAALAVATLVSSPAYDGLIVLPKSPIKTIGDLKGKRIGVTSVGSLTAWLAQQIAVKDGWPPSDVTVQALGDSGGQVAALKTGAVDAIVTGVATGYDLEDHGAGHVLFTFDSVVQHFPNNLLYARTDFIKAHPDTVKRFVTGWFKCVAYMRAHKAETVKIAADAEGISETAASRAYDRLMPSMSTNGAFNSEDLTRLSESLSDMGITSSKIDLSKYTTSEFVPVKV